MTDPPAEIPVTVDGETLPVVDLLTGRGFITGKSGSGKSVTASVIAEELLEHDLGFLIVDTDGEYYGLKEQYEVLHVGADETCDAQVSVDHAPLLAELALEDGVPIVLDVSGYLDEDERTALLERVVRELFVREKELRQPFLLVVEEAHEYLPESGGLDALGERLLQIAKRGRKRGLGICAISQRPAAVDKDFITQCNWLVWHRLTWNNDTDVVRRIIDADAAETVETLANGEALLMTDWDERVQRVTFRMRETVDVGTTPDFSAPTVPDLKPVDPALVRRLEAVGAASASNTEAAGDAATETAESNASEASGESGSAPDQDSATDSALSERDSRHAARSRASPTPAQRESLLLEVGDMMVFLFRAVRTRSVRAFRYLAQQVRSGVLGLRAVAATAAESGGTQTPSNRQSKIRLVALLAVVLGLGLLLVLFAG
ncbi:ATP-binding protein [Halorientalis brevis]|uniref:ATP-binding protein n=1 Tax=Halorientalis brevis TaxID=1126241 RepID=A0ABD6CHC1_9EURY